MEIEYPVTGDKMRSRHLSDNLSDELPFSSDQLMYKIGIKYLASDYTLNLEVNENTGKTYLTGINGIDLEENILLSRGLNDE